MLTISENYMITEPQISSCIRFIPVPLCFQETVYTCGVACVQSILANYGIIYRQDVLIEILKQKPIFGTESHEIINFMQMLGFQAIFHSGMNTELLKNYIDEGITPILLIQAWKEDDIDYTYCWRDSHYVVACGYDEHRIIFMDPYTLGNYTYIPYSELTKRWHHVGPHGTHQYFCGLIIKSQNLPMTYKPNIIKYQE